MAKLILSRINKNKKIKFDQQQLSKAITLLTQIIAKEKDPTIRNNFKNIKAVFIGTYPNLFALKQSALGLKKILKNTVSAINEEEDDNKKKAKKKAVKKILSKVLIILTASISLASCGYNTSFSAEKTYDLYGAALTIRSDDIVYAIRIEPQTIKSLETALQTYQDKGDVSGLNFMQISITDSISNVGNLEAIAITHPSGNIEMRKDVQKNDQFGVLTHELTHRIQFEKNITRTAGEENQSAVYNFNPMEINATFSSFLQQLKNNKNYVDGSSDLAIATLLVYRPTYSFNNYSSTDIKAVHSWVKQNNPSLYKHYTILASSSPETIRSYFLYGTTPKGW